MMGTIAEGLLLAFFTIIGICMVVMMVSITVGVSRMVFGF